jgi:hypothetical protein
MYHSYYYPKDVDVRVPYVGPLAYAPEDPRIYEFLDNVGTQECRERIYAFQKMILERRDTFFPMMLDLSARMGWTFQRVGGAEAAYEMAVLEYDFAFWQWGRTPCENVPLECTDDEIFRHFARIGDFSYFSDQGIGPIEPFFFQAMTEQGYYGYRFDRFEGLLNHVSDSEHPDFLFSAPQGIEMTFNPDHNKRVYDYLYNKGNNFLYIYGADDTWTATGVEMSGSPTNSLVIKKEGGDHTTRIMNLEESDREVVLTKLSEWLSISIDTLRSNVSSIRRR